jgi:ATP-binding cassette, subfamily C, bacterial PrsD
LGHGLTELRGRLEKYVIILRLDRSRSLCGEQCTSKFDIRSKFRPIPRRALFAGATRSRPSIRCFVQQHGLLDKMPISASSDVVALELRASAHRLGAVAIFSGVVNLLMLSGSLYMLQVYDRVLPSRSTATLLGLSAMVLIAYFFQAYFEAARSRMLSRIGTLFDNSLQKRLYFAVATLPLRGAKPLMAQQPMRDLDQVRTFLSGVGPTAFLDIPWSPIFLIALLVFHPLIGFVAMIGAAAIIALTVATERRSRSAARLAMDASAQRQVLADATHQNAEVIHALGMIGRFTARWAQLNERHLQQIFDVSDVYANIGAIAKVVRYALQSAILGVGAYLVIVEQASGGIMIASSIMMGRALAPIEIALANWKQLVAARQGIDRLRNILAATAPSPPPAVALPRPNQSLSVEDITVAVPGSERVVLSNISFKLTAGMAMVVLGTSAAGKSSLVRALVGVWQPTTGIVRLDGAALNNWNPDELGRHIGYLPQDVALFDGTVAENIARFDESASSDAVLGAARLAGVHEMILSLPNGYATRIGERGSCLSAGQRQRIGLARAVFGEPFLVVLDEPNANLDHDGEQALIRAIETLRKNRSVVVLVSHRPEAIAAVNMAMVLREGRVAAFGPREELFARVARSINANTAKFNRGKANDRNSPVAEGARA